MNFQINLASQINIYSTLINQALKHFSKNVINKMNYVWTKINFPNSVQKNLQSYIFKSGLINKS